MSYLLSTNHFVPPINVSMVNLKGPKKIFGNFEKLFLLKICKFCNEKKKKKKKKSENSKRTKKLKKGKKIKTVNDNLP